MKPPMAGRPPAWTRSTPTGSAQADLAASRPFAPNLFGQQEITLRSCIFRSDLKNAVSYRHDRSTYRND